MLKKQLVEKVPISPILAQINDVLVNLIASVNILEKSCPKGCIFFPSIATLHFVVKVQRTSNVPFDVSFHSCVFKPLILLCCFEMKK